MDIHRKIIADRENLNKKCPVAGLCLGLLRKKPKMIKVRGGGEGKSAGWSGSHCKVCC